MRIEVVVNGGHRLQLDDNRVVPALLQINDCVGRSKAALVDDDLHLARRQHHSEQALLSSLVANSIHAHVGAGKRAGGRPYFDLQRRLRRLRCSP